jgi:hypothetical protein
VENDVHDCYTITWEKFKKTQFDGWEGLKRAKPGN